MSPGQASDEAEHGDVLVVVKGQANVSEEEEEGHKHQQHPHQDRVSAEPGNDVRGATLQGAKNEEAVHQHLSKKRIITMIFFLPVVLTLEPYERAQANTPVILHLEQKKGRDCDVQVSDGHWVTESAFHRRGGGVPKERIKLRK